MVQEAKVQAFWDILYHIFLILTNNIFLMYIQSMY